MVRDVPIHGAENIEMARRAAQLAAEVLSMVEAHVVPGVSTEALDRICHDHIVNVQGAIPANLGYHGYPKTILTSVNQVVCHGIPSPDQILKRGDIVNIDVAVIKDGWFGDTSRMYFVGAPSAAARRLVETTYEALLAGIRQVKPGATLGDIHARKRPNRVRCNQPLKCKSTEASLSIERLASLFTTLENSAHRTALLGKLFTTLFACLRL
jgi:methionyl aminopeptidase